MSASFLLLALLVVIVVLAGRIGRPSVVPRRGRRWRALGPALIVLAVIAIVGGQAYDVSRVGAVDADVEVDVPTGSTEDLSTATRFHARFMLLDQLDLDLPIVVAHGAAEVRAGGGPLEIVPTWVGAEASDELRFLVEVARPAGGGVSVTHGVRYEGGQGGRTSSAFGRSEPAEHFDIGTAFFPRRRSFFRAFDARRADLVYAVSIRPIGEGTSIERRPYASVWSDGDEARVRQRYSRYQVDDESSLSPGFPGVMGRLSGFAFLALLLGTIGVARSFRPAGFGIALWLVLAPLLLILADRMAVDAFDRTVAEDERPAVRAAALRALDDSVFFQTTARERIAARRDDDDPEIARLAKTLTRRDPAYRPPTERVNVDAGRLLGLRDAPGGGQ